MIDVLYFAWVRERIGLPREVVETDAKTAPEAQVETPVAAEPRVDASVAAGLVPRVPTCRQT